MLKNEKSKTNSDMDISLGSIRKAGITLVSLVITIIILLILASITINLVIGNSGIIARTVQVKQDYEMETVREEVVLMLSDYTLKQYQTNQNLEDYLEQQVNESKIESVENNRDGTHTIIINDYMVTIDDEILEVIDITKAKAIPKISNLKLVVVNAVDGTETEAKDNEVLEGTPIKITFDISFEEGILVGVNEGTLENGKVEYTTNGFQQEVKFIITGKIGEEECVKTKTIILKSLYRKQYISDTVQIGDFVNYSAGQWTQSDIEKMGELYEGSSLPTVLRKFGGFEIGTSKDESISTWRNLQNKYSGGWRVLSKNDDGSVNIIHAGTPEGYLSSSGYENVKASMEVLTELRDWSMYEDTMGFSVPGSARCVRFVGDLDHFASGDSLWQIGVYYWAASTLDGGKYLTTVNASGSYRTFRWTILFWSETSCNIER